MYEASVRSIYPLESYVVRLSEGLPPVPLFAIRQTYLSEIRCRVGNKGNCQATKAEAKSISLDSFIHHIRIALSPGASRGRVGTCRESAKRLLWWDLPHTPACTGSAYVHTLSGIRPWPALSSGLRSGKEYRRTCT